MKKIGTQRAERNQSKNHPDKSGHAACRLVFSGSELCTREKESPVARSAMTDINIVVTLLLMLHFSFVLQSFAPAFIQQDLFHQECTDTTFIPTESKYKYPHEYASNLSSVVITK